MGGKLLNGNRIIGVYRRTGRSSVFFWERGAGGVDVRGCGWGRGRGARCCQAKLWAAARIARGLHRFGEGQEQKPNHVGHGGVVVSSNFSRLAVKLRFDGYGDVSDGTHGAALQKDQDFFPMGSVHQVCEIIRNHHLRWGRRPSAREDGD